jgi:ABC-type transporter Mla maintaining outer membrane lipid asymmetry ATPase subunit MlaF
LGLGVTDLYSGQEFDVELRAVTKRFGSLTAVNAVTLKVHKGEFLSLLGPVRLRQDHLVAADCWL